MTEPLDFDRLSLNDEDLLAKHRKERKELQAKIQALKKSSDKGDKKRKREVLEEIVRLELSLDQKHQEELNTPIHDKPAKTIESAIGDQPTNAQVFLKVGETNGGERVSKAQKRRDKKAQSEREKRVEILAQEELNKTGPRMTEIKNIKLILKQRKLALHPIPSDGDCLYNAVAHQLTQTGNPYKDVTTLRAMTADYILDNKDSLIFYMTNPQNGDILTDDEFVKYCQAVRQTPAWGGQIEIKALSSVLGVPIEVLQATGPPTVQNEHDFKGAALTLTYHRFMYSLGEHYNSTRPLVETEVSDDEANGSK